MTSSQERLERLVLRGIVKPTELRPEEKRLLGWTQERLDAVQKELDERDAMRLT